MGKRRLLSPQVPLRPEGEDSRSDRGLSAAAGRGDTCHPGLGFPPGVPGPVGKALESRDPAAEDTCLSPSAAAGFRTLGGRLEMVCSDENDLV